MLDASGNALYGIAKPIQELPSDAHNCLSVWYG